MSIPDIEEAICGWLMQPRQWDVFVPHAFEDKDAVAESLVEGSRLLAFGYGMTASSSDR